MPYLPCIVISSVTLALATAKPFIALIDEMLKDDGTWYLAAAGTTGVKPPWESCVKVKIKDTGKKAHCAWVFRNHTVTEARIVFFLGRNEANVTEIRSKGPMHQFMIKTTQEYDGQLSTPKEFSDDISLNAAINNGICWEGRKERPLPWRYTIMPVNNNVPVDAFFLVGVRARIQAPEYQIGIFTKGILDQDYVHSITNEMNRKLRIYFTDFCMNDVAEKYGKWYPPYCMPKMYLKCAEGYKIWDVTHKYNKRDSDDDEVKAINTGKRKEKVEKEIQDIYYHDATDTIWVRHGAWRK